LSQFKKYNPSGNLKLNNLGISQSLKFGILMESILPISLNPAQRCRPETNILEDLPRFSIYTIQQNNIPLEA